MHETYPNTYRNSLPSTERRCLSACCLCSLFCCHGFILSQTSVPQALPPSVSSSWQLHQFYTVVWLTLSLWLAVPIGSNTNKKCSRIGRDASVQRCYMQSFTRGARSDDGTKCLFRNLGLVRGLHSWGDSGAESCWQAFLNQNLTCERQWVQTSHPVIYIRQVNTKQNWRMIRISAC